jgi:voltage-gated potassium channel
MVIEGYSFLEAFYMTIITVTTVGFGEIKKLSDPGRVFTIGLIITSLGIFTYSLTALARNVIEGQVGYIIGRYKKKFKKNMKDHVIVIGYGRNGKQTVEELLYYGHKVLVIEQNHDIVVENAQKGIPFFEGNATEDETLLSAGIKEAKALIASLPTDADNLFIVLSARALNPSLTIISRASSESADKKLHMAGVDRVVMPEKVGGTHMAKLIARTEIVEFLDHLSLKGAAPTNIEEINCTDIAESQIGKTLDELQIRKLSGANIIGIKTVEQEYIINPSPDTKLTSNTKLFVLGTSKQIDKMRQILANK